MNNVKILVACHKDCERPEIVADYPDMFVPILGGAVYGDRTLSWPNALRDDQGENISCLNPHLCEFTSLYWAWKNYDMIGNPDYIGLNHYHRFLDPKIYLENNDPKMVFTHGINAIPNVFDDFDSVHGRYELFSMIEDDICSVNKFVRDVFYLYFNEQVLLGCSMFVASKQVFFDAMLFIDHLLGIIIPHIDYEEDRLYTRYYAFLLERMIGFYFYLLHYSGYKVKALNLINYKDTKL